MSDHYTYPAKVVRVVDGDTFDLRLDLGFGITNGVRVRLKGIDTAEIYGTKKDSEEHKEGQKHKGFVEEWFRMHDGYSDAMNLTVETVKWEKGKYGRYLAKIHGRDDYDSLRLALIDQYGDDVKQ